MYSGYRDGGECNHAVFEGEWWHANIEMLGRQASQEDRPQRTIPLTPTAECGDSREAVTWPTD